MKLLPGEKRFQSSARTDGASVDILIGEKRKFGEEFQSGEMVPGLVAAGDECRPGNKISVGHFVKQFTCA